MMLDVSALIAPFGALASAEKSLESKVWYLRQNRLFEAANEEAVEGGNRIFVTSLLPKKTMIFDQGDPTRVVFLIKRGKVRLTRMTADGKEVTIAVLGAGDMFGEETLFDDAPRTSHAVCIEETLICTAKADDLFALLSHDPNLALNVAKVLNDRLIEASAAMEDLAYAKIPDRLINLFDRLVTEHGVETPEGVRIDVRLTHADVASLIGSTRETVSLEMSKLVKAGSISYDGDKIVVPKRS